MAKTTNVTISEATHKRLIAYIQSIDGKIGKWVEKVLIKELDKVEKKNI